MTWLWILLAWIYASFGVHSMFWLVRPGECYWFVRWLPLPPEPHIVNLNRVVATTLRCLVAFTFWPLFWWQRFRKLGADGTNDRP